MTDAIVVALITLAGTIIGIVVSAKSTRDSVTQELKTQNEIKTVKMEQLSENIEQINKNLIAKVDNLQKITEIKFENIERDMNVMKNDLADHNHYAQLFNEKVPVIQEKQTVANHRLDDLEADFKKLRDKL